MGLNDNVGVRGSTKCYPDHNQDSCFTRKMCREELLNTTVRYRSVSYLIVSVATYPSRFINLFTSVLGFLQVVPTYRPAI